MYTLVVEFMFPQKSTPPEAFHRYLIEKEINLWDSEHGPEGRCRNKWPVMICSTQSERKDKTY